MEVRPRDVLFFDEIHALPRRLGEALYQAVEDGVIDLPFVDGIRTQSVRLKLPDVTIIGATTNAERMPGPLVARFRAIQLAPYSADDLAEIVRRAAVRDGVAIDGEALPVIAGASFGVARMAIEIYTATRTVIEAAGRKVARQKDAREALRMLDLDERGFGPVHRRVLEVLRKHKRPLAVRRVATWSGITVEAFRRFYEASLMISGAIVPTPRGIALAPGS
jgi:Holliday junction DNA helicase RuvB